ncbi:MAG: DUF5711 family protein [Oscillospiraceae bacterium]|jgi:hypothetical protein|nr:DUF5711 family protein [Oscillospiraceae bacterium]
MKNPNDITKYRRGKKRGKLALKPLVAAIIAAGAAFAAFNAETALAPFEGIARNLFGKKPSGAAGFPVRLPGSAGYFFGAYDGGFMLLTDTYIYTYGENGALINSLQHGYANPRASVNDKKILAYDQNGRQFSFYGRNGRVYEHSAEDRIVYAEIGENEAAAVVFRGTAYASVLEVYDGKGRWKYRRRFVDEHIMRAAFMNGDRELIVASIGFDSGDNTATVRKFNVNSEDEEGLWKTALPPNVLPFALREDSGDVFVLCDAAIFVIDAESGVMKGGYEYSGVLIDYAFHGDAGVLLVDDYLVGDKMLLVIDGNGELSCQADVGYNAVRVEAFDVLQGSAVYVMENDRVTEYTWDLSLSGEYVLGDEYSEFIKIKNYFYLLGYDTVERKPLLQWEREE